jgi:hypothetical protein
MARLSEEPYKLISEEGERMKCELNLFVVSHETATTVRTTARNTQIHHRQVRIDVDQLE